MTDSLLLGFFSPQPHESATGWGRAQTEAVLRPRNSEVTATRTAQPYLQSALAANARDWFDALAREWHQATSAHSSMTIRKRHPAYRSMVELGWPIVPLLLRALRDMPDMWFPILRDITKENPVRSAEQGDYQKMTDAWLAWGRKKQIIV